jgi:hypothetical protein
MHTVFRLNNECAADGGMTTGKKNFFRCHFAHYRATELNPNLRREKPAANFVMRTVLCSGG